MLLVLEDYSYFSYHIQDKLFITIVIARDEAIFSFSGLPRYACNEEYFTIFFLWLNDNNL